MVFGEVHWQRTSSPVSEQSPSVNTGKTFDRRQGDPCALLWQCLKTDRRYRRSSSSVFQIPVSFHTIIGCF
ncbi:hypothetical protein T01_11992, partial [Trichinella spiralis]